MYWQHHGNRSDPILGRSQAFLQHRPSRASLCLFLPGLVTICSFFPGPALFLVFLKSTQLRGAQSIFTPWLQKQMFRSSPDAFTSSSCRSSASQALQSWKRQLTGPSFCSKQMTFELQEADLGWGCSSRLGHLPSTLVLQNRIPKPSRVKYRKTTQ